VFAALADDTRRQLVSELADGSPRTATQLATHYDMTRQGLLKHLRILAGAGLVRVQQQGKEKRFTLTPEPLAEVNRWTQAISDQWDTRLLRLKTMLEAENDAEG
jgi:DNA-binding transcriptional ArsR family regulator